MHSRLPLCVAIALTVAGMLSMPGCGVRGSLEAPPGAKVETGNATPGTPAKAEPAQHKPSILDPLIR
jgi:predicted small lipoprotein YifL